MNQKETQNLHDNKDKKVPINVEDSNGNGIDTNKDIKEEEIEELASVKKTRSSKRLTTHKSLQDNIDLKLKNVESVEESHNKDVEAPVKVIETENVEVEQKTEELNGSSTSQAIIEETPDNSQVNGEESDRSSEIKEKEQNTSKEDFILDTETYMDPLVLQPDEPCPELEFEESSDKESEKHSPVLSRCITRRSQNRNIPTPNTPRSIYEPELEKDQIDSGKGPATPAAESECSTKNNNFNDTDSSNTNTSMTVQVGGNDTRTDFSEGESELLQNLRSKSSNSRPCYLTSRRSVRSARNDVYSKNFRDSVHRSKLYIPSPLARESVERAPSVKRKERSETPEERKKFKSENSGFLSKLSSPLTNLKNKFTTTPTGTSTPKLTSYRDENNHIDGDYFNRMEMPEDIAEQQNKWCEIM